MVTSTPRRGKNSRVRRRLLSSCFLVCERRKSEREAKQAKTKAHVSLEAPSPSAFSAHVCVQVCGADATVRGLSASDTSALSTTEKSVAVARHDAAETARYPRQAR